MEMNKEKDKVHANYLFLQGGGEMGALARDYDWSRTSLGDPSAWDHSLRTTIGIVLSSKFPMMLMWGPDHIQFYNDAYRALLGDNGKHPTALGQKAVDCWPEIWETAGILINHIYTTGEATWNEDQLIPIHRNGQMEDVYWTYTYTPVTNDMGIIDGVLVVCQETTEKVNYKLALQKKVEQRAAELLSAQAELEQKIAALQRSNKDLEAFTYAASHDLKAPVRKIHFFADAIKQSAGDRLTEKERDFFDWNWK